MELWIRSQDREKMLKVDELSLIGMGGHKVGIGTFTKILKNDDYCNYLGTYKDKKRALEILDEISSKIKNSYLIKNEMLLSSKDIKEQLNIFEEALNGSAIIQTPAYDIEPINTNIVYYEMPKE